MIKHTIVYNDNIDVSEELEIHTIDGFSKIEKFIGNDNVDFRTTYSKEGSSFRVHTHGVHNGVQLDAHAVDSDLYKGIDIMVAKLESQLRTAKSKRTSINREIDVSFDESDDSDE